MSETVLTITTLNLDETLGTLNEGATYFLPGSIRPAGGGWLAVASFQPGEMLEASRYIRLHGYGVYAVARVIRGRGQGGVVAELRPVDMREATTR